MLEATACTPLKDTGESLHTWDEMYYEYKGPQTSQRHLHICIRPNNEVIHLYFKCEHYF